MLFEVKECSDSEIIKELFVEYSHIKGTESCFVSSDKELNNLAGYYSGGAILIGYEEGKPVASVAIRKISDTACEGKRLFIKPEHRGKGYARIMLKAMTDKASELGFKERGCGQNPGHFDTVKDYGVTLFQRAGSCRTHVV
ncbi:MAG: GNAT family N-acetyltransferase [Lachnospiraceae bacterium]|nr:GNAT family N-acetyltransferase [Lachnospiraceae bacterium]